MRRELGLQMKLFSKNTEKMIFANSFLNLFRLLLQRGFFNEPLFEFFDIDLLSDNNNNNNAKIVKNSNNSNNNSNNKSTFSNVFNSHKFNFLSFENDVNDSFNLNQLETVLEEKLIEAIELHRNFDLTSKKNNNDNINNKNEINNNNGDNNEDDDNIDNVKNKNLTKKKSMLAANYESNLLTDKFDVDIIKETSKKTSTRSNLEKFEEIKSYFDGLFADTIYTSVVKNVIAILTDIYTENMESNLHCNKRFCE
jgi:hypothetical protein